MIPRMYHLDLAQLNLLNLRGDFLLELGHLLLDSLLNSPFDDAVDNLLDLGWHWIIGENSALIPVDDGCLDRRNIILSI